jgi:hypothetical protein
MNKYSRELLTFTHDVVTNIQELVTATQMPFYFLKLNENDRIFYKRFISHIETQDHI